MFCLEGTGSVSHMSVRNHPEVFNEPCMFAAISVKGFKNGTKVLEGQVPDRAFSEIACDRVVTQAFGRFYFDGHPFVLHGRFIGGVRVLLGGLGAVKVGIPLL